MTLSSKPPELTPSQSKDLSARQLYQKSRLAHKRLNTLLKFLPDPVFAFTLDKKVEYINPAFERVFGWTLNEVKGRSIRFIPDHLLDQAKQGMRDLFRNRSIHDFETQRYTRDGRILDIVINGSILYDEQDTPIGQVLILRDMTHEKRMARTNQIMLKISRALHQYHELGDLIAFINREIQTLVSVEGTFILLADEKEDQLYFFSAQYRNAESEKKFKKIRFPADQGVSGRVYKTGEPLLIPDAAQCSFFLRRVDEETDLTTRNILSVPIQLKDRIIGVISVVNKLHGAFDNTDMELLSMVAGTIALPIENTRIHEELLSSYKKLKTLNQVKDKVINHLAHELKTPISVLGAVMTLLSKKLAAQGVQNPVIEKIFERGKRNLNRILDIQYEVEDLLRKKDFKAYHILTRLLEACRDELTLLFETQTQDQSILGQVQKTLDDLFGPQEIQFQHVCLDAYLTEQIQKIKPAFSFRKCTLTTWIEKSGQVYIPTEILDIVFRGLIRNAVEYTPDGGKIDIVLRHAEDLPELVIKDTGIGFTREKLSLLFENYFTPPDVKEYSTKNAFEFNAGGRGFDLLRMKLFSERYAFDIWIDSIRCPVILKDTDVCPGDIGLCTALKTPADCFKSGGTTVHIRFLSEKVKKEDPSNS